MSVEFRDFRNANVLSADGTQAYRPVGTRRVGPQPNKRLLLTPKKG